MAHYFAYNERFSEPILSTQVIDLLVDFNATRPERPFRLTVFQNPVFFFRERATRRKAVAAARAQGLRIDVYPFALPTRGWLGLAPGVALHRALFAVTSLWLPRAPTVCRGYLASWLLLQRARGERVVADPRSLYVRENIGVRWRAGDPNYAVWSRIELEIVRRADAVTAVNDSMVAYFRELAGERAWRVVLAPIYSRGGQARANTARTSWTCVRLIYVGSLGLSKWNDIHAYRKFFEALRPFAGSLHITLVVKHAGPLIDELVRDLQSWGLALSLHTGMSPASVREQLASADVGLSISDPWEDADARTGIKTIEYLGAGLPIWTTQHLASVARLVRDGEAGHVFGSSSPSPAEVAAALKDLQARGDALRRNASRIFGERFSPASVLAMLDEVVHARAEEAVPVA